MPPPPYVGHIVLGRNQNGRLELVTTTPAPGSVWQLRQVREDDWPARWRSLDMPYSVDGWPGPAIASNKDGRLEVAFMTLKELLHAWQTEPNGDQWQHESLDWPSDMQLEQVRPELTQNKDGRLEVFVLAKPSSGGTTALWHRWQQTQGGWSPWTSLDAPDQVGLKTLAVAQNGDGRLEAFALGEDKALWHRWQQTQGGWSPWTSRDAPDQVGLFTGSGALLAVARNRDGRLEAFALGEDKAVWHIWQQTQGGWSPWSSLEGQPDGSFFGYGLAVGAHADGRLVLFVVAKEADATSQEPNVIWQREQAVAGRWSPWRSFRRPHGPRKVGDPALALDANGQLQLWTSSPGSVELYRLKQTKPNGSEWNSSSWHFLPSPEPPSYAFRPAGGPPD
jgi:hypothetical protein